MCLSSLPWRPHHNVILQPMGRRRQEGARALGGEDPRGGRPGPPSARRAFETTSGFRIRRLYTPADLEDHDYISADGFPGEYPFTRGVQPTMYRGGSGPCASTPASARPRSRTRATATCSRRGRRACRSPSTCRRRWATTPTTPLARGEVGKVGVAIDSLRDMETLLAGIPLDRVSTSMTINATAAILLALYVAVARAARRRAASARRAPSRTTSSRSTSRAATTSIPPAPSLRLATDIIAYCAGDDAALEPDLHQRLPHPRGRLDGRAGGRLHARQRHRLRRDACARAASTLDAFAPRLSFFFNAQSNLLRGGRQVPRRAPAVGARS